MSFEFSEYLYYAIHHEVESLSLRARIEDNLPFLTMFETEAVHKIVKRIILSFCEILNFLQARLHESLHPIGVFEDSLLQDVSDLGKLSGNVRVGLLAEFGQGVILPGDNGCCSLAPINKTDLPEVVSWTQHLELLNELILLVSNVDNAFSSCNDEHVFFLSELVYDDVFGLVQLSSQLLRN